MTAGCWRIGGYVLSDSQFVQLLGVEVLLFICSIVTRKRKVQSVFMVPFIALLIVLAIGA